MKRWSVETRSKEERDSLSFGTFFDTQCRKTMIQENPQPATPVHFVMRLFVWEGFCPDHSDGLAFAIAENIEEAQKLVVKSRGYTPSDWGTVREFPVTEPRAYCVSGGG